MLVIDNKTAYCKDCSDEETLQFTFHFYDSECLNIKKTTEEKVFKYNFCPHCGKELP